MRTALLILVALSSVAACSQREILIRRSAIPPPDSMLDGRWTLRPDSADTNRRIDDDEFRTAGGNAGIFERPGADAPRKRRHSLVHVFLETGSELKITQTANGLFISFDRSVVEEYRFGEYRTVSVGPVNAQRSSGWEQGAYVIETLDADGNKLYERWRYDAGSGLLIREITIYRRKDPELSVVQRFSRTGG